MADANKHITYSLADIQRYLQGGMTAKEMHDLERAALEDPFLADALEGYSEANMQQAHMHLAQIETSIRQPQQQGKLEPMPPSRKFRNWQLAASIMLLIGVASVTYFIFNKKSGELVLAKNESSPAVPPADTVQPPLQTLKQQNAPLFADTATIVKDNAAQGAANSAPSTNNKKISKEKRKQPAAEMSAQMTSRANKERSTGSQEETVMALQAPANELAGTVTDNNHQPIPNAKVILQDSTAVVTDKDGAFRMAITDSAAVASVSAFGYKPLKNQQLKRGNNTITLKEKPFLLSDVEVVKIGVSGKQTADTATAMPEGGLQSFREYVYQKLNKKYDSTAVADVYIDGDLQLEFSINDAGEPVNFKVLQAPDAQTASEAISAIKAGPKWIKGNKKDKMRVTVKYK